MPWQIFVNNKIFLDFPNPYQDFDLLLNPTISMKTLDIPIFFLSMCIGSSTIPLNRAIILIEVVVESSLVIEDGPYFLGKALW